MTNKELTNLAAAYLNAKRAEQLPQDAMPPHETQETPEAEALEHAPGGEEAHGEGGPHDEATIDHLLSQLSPEELEELASALAEDMQSPQAPQAGGEQQDVAGLAQAIQSHLASNPEASAPGVSPEKQAALSFVKSASYIEGFINQAIDRGVSIKQAVDMYDVALLNTLNSIKTAELKGNQSKLDVNNNGKIDADDLAKLRGGKKKDSTSDDVKTAAYFEGMIERAREYGIGDMDTLELVKSSGAMNRMLSRGGSLSPASLERLGLTASEAAGGLSAASAKDSGLVSKIRAGLRPAEEAITTPAQRMSAPGGRENFLARQAKHTSSKPFPKAESGEYRNPGLNRAAEAKKTSTKSESPSSPAAPSAEPAPAPSKPAEPAAEIPAPVEATPTPEAASAAVGASPAEAKAIETARKAGLTGGRLTAFIRGLRGLEHEAIEGADQAAAHFHSLGADVKNNPLTYGGLAAAGAGGTALAGAGAHSLLSDE
jgi:hypothetical protein